MKKTFPILFCLFFSIQVFANTEKTNAEKNDESKSVDAKKEAESVENSEQSETNAEPDSSYYSVNKFNFLFYFVYKMKYMEDETEVEAPKK
ncbi:hypothetical protein N7E81_02780 [Reichenbachiella carrageenanivorans]|uniref:Uncharacterized protein n=1 Tax=Reichenbachiella carrageenanivorans TaxID=2979869 RepID=A0ABY6D2P8_9BACT|nr:hypothetical protein [Reichenbachiella carrageenanivorans]UXX80029.1 hypothetical protein N7E81_02780 [Reichenbachiella carrageenanivorans]